MENIFRLAPATPADTPHLTRFVNAAYRGDTARQGWTTEADLLDGQRIDEPGMRELLDAPGPARPSCSARTRPASCWAASTRRPKAKCSTSPC